MLGKQGERAGAYFVVMDSELFASLVFVKSRLKIALHGNVLGVKVD